MRILDITPITDSAQMPIKKGTLQFLQDSHKETVANLIIGIIGSSYSTSKVYRLYGAELIGGGGDSYPNTAGAVFYNGEVYLVDAIGGIGTNMPDGIDMEVYTTQYTTDADPVTFSDATTHNVHNIRKMRYKNNASPVLGQPVNTKLINKFSGTITSLSTSTDEITVKTDCNRYYRLNAVGGASSPITIKIDTLDRAEGGKAKIFLNTDSSAGYISIICLTSGQTIDVAGNVVLGDEPAMISIEYFGNNYYACFINQAYGA